MPADTPLPPAGGGRRGPALDPGVRRMLANSSWLLGARGVNVPLALAESILLARLLGPAGFGALGIVMTAVGLLNRLFSFRLSDLVVKFMSDALAERRRGAAAATLKAALAVEALTSAVAFLAALALASLTARWFLPEPAAAGWIRLYALVMLANATLESSTGALQVFDRFALQARVQVGRKVLAVAGIVAVWWTGGGLEAILVVYLVSQGAGTLYQTGLAAAEAGRRLGGGWWREPLRRLRPRWREMCRFALSTNLAATLKLVVQESDLLWVAWFRTPGDAGFYRLATSLLKVPFAAGSPMAAAFYPQAASAIARGEIDRTRRLLRQSTLLAATWVLPVVAGVFAFSPWIVRTFYGAEFLPAVPALWLLAPGLGAAQLFFWTRPALLALGRPGAALQITALHSVLKVVLALVLVPIWGFLGLAGILTALYWLGVALALLVIRGELQERSA